MTGDFIVIEIGCLECCIPSSLVGRFETLQEAATFADSMNAKHGSDVSYAVFNINHIEEVI